MKGKFSRSFPCFLLLMGQSVSAVWAGEIAMPANRLAKEKSPYLLQHAHNPVDWHPWGREAFEKAAKEDKPVILSIGYSTCHWCHVMEKESFEDVETARLMNRDFVSIKVDREERPDIDSVYMSYVTATTGGGGWPMTVFLTPDKKPFYGGTYFPPEDRFGMPGFKTLLSSLADAWKNRRDEISKSADSAVSFLNEKKPSAGEKALTLETIREGFDHFASSFDPSWGGFGRAPKFPRSHSLSFLLRYWHRTGDALEIIEKTLKAMARGGLYDQLGGGFHRYSTDGQWRVPHFEKMLYDQALLARTYLEAYQATRDKFYARVARETLDYVLREMTAPEGGFYSAQDADSGDPDRPDQKREGAFYVWTKKEIEKELPQDAGLFSYFYGVEERGNALEDPHGEFKGQNVLYEARSLGETAAHFHLTEKEAADRLAHAREKLLPIRSRRPRPHLDDKVLADWNGLMISSFAFASRVLEEPRYAEAASRAGEFVSRTLKDEKGRLLHRYRDGEAAIAASLNDYAFLAYGYLALYEATFEEKWLVNARDTAVAMLKFFWDKEQGGFFLTAFDAETLLSRPKEFYDGAVPSGNSMAALDLLLLARLTGDERFGKAADGTLRLFSRELGEMPIGYPQMLVALDFAIGPSSEIVIASDAKDPALGAFLKEIYAHFLPNKIILLHKPGKEGKALEAVAPFVEGKSAPGNGPAIFICRNYACQLPVINVEELRKALESKH